MHAAHQTIVPWLPGLDKPADLEAMPARYYSDKGAGLHWFTPHYERHMNALRDKPVRVLEIGVGGDMTTTHGGGALRGGGGGFPPRPGGGAGPFSKNPGRPTRGEALLLPPQTPPAPRRGG